MFLLFLIFLIFLKPAYAADEFNIVQNIYYSVNTSGVANVRQEVNLTNKFSQIYAKEYQISLTGTTLQNVTGNDSYGDIINQVTTSGETTNITLKFSHPVAGKDQTNKFFLNYNIPNFAKKKGNTWEIQFPLFNNQNDQQSVQILLEVPTSFGELSFASTSIKSTHSLGEKTQITLSPLNQSNKILLVFGNHQLFDFTLNYYLNNSQKSNIITQIPIPPDTNYQDIILSKINPQPINIITDVDGNWLAQYQLAPSESISVEVSGQAKIHPFHPNKYFIDTTKYLQTQSFWPVTDPAITTISDNLPNIKSIYKYVVDTLDYNYNQIDSAKRQGAINAINSPQLALCTEFTDLFVTLARSKKIPSREIEGFAYSNNSKVKPLNTNSDVLHAWPEYYDTALQAWIQVDPTWEKTTNGIDYFNDLDLNHLTFVIHGLSSETPPPPGSYRNPQNGKSVFVDFASSEIKPTLIPPKITIENDLIIVRNQNVFSLNNFHVNDNSVNVLPPLSTTSFKLPAQNILNALKSATYNLNISYSESTNVTHQTISNRTHYLYLSICIGLAILILCIGGIIVTASSKIHEKNS